jgi:DNA gyrase subunit A
VICGKSGIHRAYTTGRGQLVVRARATIEALGKDREQIVITELPYQVNPLNVFEKVKTLIADKVIEGISYINDETDRREGLRLIFEIKKGHQGDVVLNQLFRYTQLQNTFSVILLALSGLRPRTFNLKEILAEFRDHRIDVITRRTRFLKRKAEERLHIVQGLLIAIADIDEVVRIIRSSKSPDEAKLRLREHFLLSERQTDAILAMRLARLTGLEVEKLIAEREDLEKAIARYEEILGDIREIHKLIIAEMHDLMVRFAEGRRTEISDDDLDIEDEALIPEGSMLVTLSHHGYIKRMNPDIYRTQGRGGVGITGADTKEGDFIERLIVADNKDYFLIFTTWGWVHWLKVYRIPELGRGSLGRFIENLIPLRDEGGEGGRGKEAVASIIPVKEFGDDRFLVTLSRNGRIKKTSLSEYGRPKKNGIIGVGIKEDDRLVRAVVTDGDRDLLVSTSQGQTIRFSEKKVRSMGRGAAGVIAVKFKKEKDHVVDLVVDSEDAMLLTVSENGYGMRTRLSDYPVKGRGGLGVVNMKGLSRNGSVVLARAVHDGEDVILITEGGMIVRSPGDSIRLVGRGSQGVRVMRLKDGDRLVAGVVLEGVGEEDLSSIPTLQAPTDQDDSQVVDEPDDDQEGDLDDEVDTEPDDSDDGES